MATSPSDQPIRRLIYKSVPTRRDGDSDLSTILAAARLNNGLEGVSGVLLATPFLYLQVLEGSPDAVQFLFDRIRPDPRHMAVSVLADDLCDKRAFGEWTMASMDDDQSATLFPRIKRFLADANERVRNTFEHVMTSN